MRVIFVRHGETAHNVGMVITSGVPGNPLTEVGVAQVEQTAEALRATGVTALYSSPLLRARQSAEILGKALDLPVDYDDALRECDVGALEGRSDEASFVRFNEALDEWYLKENQDFPLGPGGETAASVVNRTDDRRGGGAVPSWRTAGVRRRARGRRGPEGAHPAQARVEPVRGGLACSSSHLISGATATTLRSPCRHWCCARHGNAWRTSSERAGRPHPGSTRRSQRGCCPTTPASRSGRSRLRRPSRWAHASTAGR